MLIANLGLFLTVIAWGSTAPVIKELLKEWDNLQTLNFSDRKQVREHIVKCLKFIDSLQTTKKEKTKIKKIYLKDLQNTLKQNIGK